MDFVKKAAEKVTHPQGQTGQGAAGQGAAGSDYGDKGLAAIEKQAGFGGKVNAEQNEKITDKARALYEEKTGNKVSNKISN